MSEDWTTRPMDPVVTDLLFRAIDDTAARLIRLRDELDQLDADLHETLSAMARVAATMVAITVVRAGEFYPNKHPIVVFAAVARSVVESAQSIRLTPPLPASCA